MNNWYERREKEMAAKKIKDIEDELKTPAEPVVVDSSAFLEEANKEVFGLGGERLARILMAD